MLKIFPNISKARGFRLKCPKWHWFWLSGSRFFPFGFFISLDKGEKIRNAQAALNENLILYRPYLSRKRNVYEFFGLNSGFIKDRAI